MNITDLRKRAVTASPWPFAFPAPETFRRLRRSVEAPQDGLAAVLGVSRDTVARYEAGSTRVPTSLLAEWPLKVISVLAEEAARLHAELPGGAR
jgi:predicted transcriptional regulator